MVKRTCNEENDNDAVTCDFSKINDAMQHIGLRDGV